MKLAVRKNLMKRCSGGMQFFGALFRKTQSQTVFDRCRHFPKQIWDSMLNLLLKFLRVFEIFSGDLEGYELWYMIEQGTDNVLVSIGGVTYNVPLETLQRRWKLFKSQKNKSCCQNFWVLINFAPFFLQKHQPWHDKFAGAHEIFLKVDRVHKWNLSAKASNEFLGK